MEIDQRDPLWLISNRAKGHSYPCTGITLCIVQHNPRIDVFDAKLYSLNVDQMTADAPDFESAMSHPVSRYRVLDMLALLSEKCTIPSGTFNAFFGTLKAELACDDALLVLNAIESVHNVSFLPLS